MNFLITSCDSIHSLTRQKGDSKYVYYCRLRSCCELSDSSPARLCGHWPCCQGWEAPKPGFPSPPIAQCGARTALCARSQDTPQSPSWEPQAAQSFGGQARGRRGGGWTAAFLCSLQKAVTTCTQGPRRPESCTECAGPSSASGHLPVPPRRTVSQPGTSRSSAPQGAQTERGQLKKNHKSHKGGCWHRGRYLGSAMSRVGGPKLRPDPQACPPL